MANKYTAEALQERFGDDLLIITPKQCKGLKKPFAYLDWEFEESSIKMESPLETMIKVIKSIDEQQRC